MLARVSTGRAPALSRAERRASLVQAYLTEARESGTIPTTRRIAARAGVAEGTIFRVFATKEGLRDGAVDAAFCPSGWHRAIAQIDPGLELEDLFAALAQAMQERFLATFELMRALGMTHPPISGDHSACIPAGRHVVESADSDGPAGCPLDQLLSDPVVELLEPHRDRLACTPQQAFQYLRLLVFSGSHAGITDGRVLSPADMARIILHGILAASSPPASDVPPATTRPGKVR